MDKRAHAELVTHLATEGYPEEALMWANVDFDWSREELKKIGMFFDAAMDLDTRFKVAEEKSDRLALRAWKALIKKVPGLCKFITMKDKVVQKTMDKLNSLAKQWKELTQKIKAKGEDAAEAFKQRHKIITIFIKVALFPGKVRRIPEKLLQKLVKKISGMYIKIIIKAFKFILNRKKKELPFSGFQEACRELKGPKTASLPKRVPVPCCRG